MRIFFAAIAISSLLVAAGCDAGTGDDGGTADGTVADSGADAGSTADTGSTGGDAGATSADAGGPTKVTYASIVIYDGSKAKPTVCSGTGPGADIDYVELWRGPSLIAVGKPGSPNYAASKEKGCDENKHGAAKDVEAITGGPGDVPVKDASAGYLSLAGGSVEVQFGKCTNAAAKDATECDGKGDVALIEAGDKIKVYEIGPTYKTDFKLFKGCKCAAEGYEVDARVEMGKSGAGDNFLGGTAGDIATLEVKKPGS